MNFELTQQSSPQEQPIPAPERNEQEPLDEAAEMLGLFKQPGNRKDIAIALADLDPAQKLSDLFGKLINNPTARAGAIAASLLLVGGEIKPAEAPQLPQQPIAHPIASQEPRIVHTPGTETDWRNVSYTETKRHPGPGMSDSERGEEETIDTSREPGPQP